MKRLLPLVVLTLLLCSLPAYAAEKTVEWKGQTWTLDERTTATVNEKGHLVLTSSSSYNGPTAKVSVAGKRGITITAETSDGELIDFKLSDADGDTYIKARMEIKYDHNTAPKIQGYKDGNVYNAVIDKTGAAVPFDENNKEMTFSTYFENGTLEYSLADIKGVTGDYPADTAFTTFELENGGFSSPDEVVFTDFAFVEPDPVQHTVSVTVGDNGASSVSGNLQVSNERSLELIFTPESTYVVDKVLLNGVALPDDRFTAGEGFVKKLLLENITSSQSINATFKKHPPLSVNVIANKGGTVEPSGMVSVPYGDSISVAYTAAEGYELDEVYVDGDDVWSPKNPHVIENVTKNMDVSVEFKLKEYYVRITKKNWSGSTDPYSSPTVKHGADQRIAFNPSSGKAVGEVIIDGTKTYYGIPYYDFKNITEERTVSVDFVTADHTVTPTAPTGGTIFPADPVATNANGKASFIFTPNPGLTVKRVLVDGVEVAQNVTEYTIEDITADKTIAVEFEGTALVQHTVTPTAGLGGAISPASAVTVTEGENATFTFTPDDGYRVYQVLVDNVNVADSVAAYTISNITGDKNIRVDFESIQYNVNATTTSGGTITPSGSFKVKQGASKTFTFAPQEGYAVKEVKVNGNKVAGNVAAYTLADIRANTTVQVIYEPVASDHTITVTKTSGGAVSETGDINVKAGTNKTFTFTPDAGYEVKKVTVDGTAVTTANSYTFSAVADDHTLNVEFAKKQYSVAITPSSNGTVTSSASNVAHGDTVTFTVTPASNYKLSAFTVNGQSIAVSGTTATVTATENITAAATFVKKTDDSDGDGLEDAWEMKHFGSLDKDGTADSDNDGLTDIEEYRLGSNPKNSDSDGDGMPDGWEVENGLDLNVNDANEDKDGDGYTNKQEFDAGTNANNANDKPGATNPSDNKIAVPILKMLMD